jgi:hypothetical protein
MDCLATCIWVGLGPWWETLNSKLDQIWSRIMRRRELGRYFTHAGRGFSWDVPLCRTSDCWTCLNALPSFAAHNHASPLPWRYRRLTMVTNTRHRGRKMATAKADVAMPSRLCASSNSSDIRTPVRRPYSNLRTAKLPWSHIQYDSRSWAGIDFAILVVRRAVSRFRQESFLLSMAAPHTSRRWVRARATGSSR